MNETAWFQGILNTKKNIEIINILKKKQGNTDTTNDNLNNWIHDVTENTTNSQNSTTAGSNTTASNTSSQSSNTVNNDPAIPLGLIGKLSNKNAVCWDGKIEQGEVCDDGVNNGKANYCSADCLHAQEAQYGNSISSNALTPTSYQRNSLSGFVSFLKNTKKIIFSVLSAIIHAIVGVYTAARSALDRIEQSIKDALLPHMWPSMRALVRWAITAIENIATYSVIWIICLLGALAAALQAMVYRTKWWTYTIQPGDTYESIGNQFTMTSRAISKRNKIKWPLKPGTKIRVRNRVFIEKDYLDQLKSVLTDALKTGKHTHIAEKVEKMLAKK